MAGTGGILVILLLLLGGSPTSTRSAEAETCNKRVNITFTTLPPADVIEGPEAVTNSGLLSLFLRLHRAFGGMYFSADLPGEVTKSDNLDASLVMDLLWGSSGVLLLIVASIVMAVLVPCIGLVVVCVRYRQPPVDAQPETENQAAARVKWSLCFWMLLSSLIFMVLGALLTKGHASVAWDGVQKQGHYLADSIPGVFHRPINDLGVIAGSNFRELLSALDHRLDDCSEKAASIAGNAADTDPLRQFVSTALKHLLRVSDLIERIEQAANSDEVKKVRNNVLETLKYIAEAQAVCKGPCDVRIGEDLQTRVAQLEEFLRNSEAHLPPILEVLKKKLAKDNLSRYLAQIPSKKKVANDLRNQAKETKATLHLYADRFSRSVGELNDSVKRSVEEFKKALVSLDNPPDDVAMGLGIYEAVVTVVAGVITIIATLYVLGNRCSIWRVQMGCCSFKTASWTMTIAVFMFVLFFPMLVIVSTVGMATGMVADRALCVPAQDLGAPGSLSFVEFVANRLGNKEADNGSAALHQDDTAMTYPLRITNRPRRRGGDSSKPRHLVATSRSHSRRRSIATLTTSKRRHGAKHPATGQGLARKTVRHFESLERGESRRAPQTRRRRRRRQQGDGDIGGVEPPADRLSALQKQFTAEALKGVLERFAQCSSAKLPLVKLLGKELVTNLARVILGKDSPWLGLVDDTAGPPKFEALDNLGRQWSVLNIGKDVMKRLNVFTNPPINVTNFKEISTMADAAKSGFSYFEATKGVAGGHLPRAGPASASIRKLMSALEEALNLKAAFGTQMDIITQAEKDLEKACTVEGKSLDTYVGENLAKWGTMESGLQRSINKVLAIFANAKAGLKNDVLQLFEHAKEEIREHIGDCRPFYVLYKSTVEAACDQGVRLLAVYWSSIWWFLVLGLPSTIVALILIGHFARAAVPAEVAKDSVAQRTSILTASASVEAAASSVNSSVPASQLTHE